MAIIGIRFVRLLRRWVCLDGKEIGETPIVVIVVGVRGPWDVIHYCQHWNVQSSAAATLCRCVKGSLIDTAISWE